MKLEYEMLKNKLTDLMTHTVTAWVDGKAKKDEQIRGVLVGNIDFFHQEKKIIINIETAGLTLSEKMHLEQVLKAALLGAHDFKEFELTTYFVSKNSTTKNSPSRPRLRTIDTEQRAFGVLMNKRPLPGVKNIILVGSGKGGVGKSTVSANLAVALSLGYKVGYVDADIYGPSAAQMLGGRGPLRLSPEGRLEPHQLQGLKVISFAFLASETEPVLWRGPMVAKAIKQMFFDVDWGELDYLIVDLPPGTGDVQLAIIEQVPITGALIVSSAQEVALIDAIKAVEMFRKLDVPILGLVENMAYFECGHCTAKHYLYGQNGLEKVAKNYDVPILQQIPFILTIREDSDQGTPSGSRPLEVPGKLFADLATEIIGKTKVN